MGKVRRKETIVFDIDGTLTDFNKFLKDNAYRYLKDKYNILPQDETQLELEDIYGLDLSKQEDKKILDSFWIGPYFLKYTLLERLRTNASKCIAGFKSKGFNVEIHTSRARIADKSAIGFIARLLTRVQMIANGLFIPHKNIFYYKDDESKMQAILDRAPLIVFDDKKEIIDYLSNNNIRTVCVSGQHNVDVEDTKFVKKIDSFEQETIDSILGFFLTQKDIRCINDEIKSQSFYNKIKIVGTFIYSYYKPIVLNAENIVDDVDSVLYAPNHRSTLDPLIIESVLKRHIHWAALLRFFRGEDSIFNNSKNKILCQITKWLFVKLHFFPIERKSDNEKANNYESIKDMSSFLKNNYYVGIFPEGTTNRKSGDFGTFDPAFLTLAKKNNSWIQPITLFWTNEKRNKHKVIVNIGKRFKVSNLDIKEAYDIYMHEQICSMEENKRFCQTI
ncbi:MAG: 1-acyl-sn-glycerol-3-phosphate acyltransferase [Lachnospiraceae bacterium]|nr:1-acyl-sn-glycerol-3-phosphate acyltransferase [Lachnospiraceae bacterium]